MMEKCMHNVIEHIIYNVCVKNEAIAFINKITFEILIFDLAGAIFEIRKKILSPDFEKFSKCEKISMSKLRILKNFQYGL